MAIPFPSLEFFEALKKRTTEDPVTFEKLGTCDTSFGVRIGDDRIRICFEVYECVEVAEGGDAGDLDFVLSGKAETWKEMVQSILANGGADGAHTLNTLSHVGDVIAVEYEDAEGHDCFYRFMATIQEFFDQARHVPYGLQHLKWIIDHTPERKEQLHLALDEAENMTLNQFDSALFEAMIVCAGKGTKPDQIKKGIEIVGLLQIKQVEEYFHCLRRAGFEERIERSKFRELMAQAALLQQDPQLPD